MILYFALLGIKLTYGIKLEAVRTGKSLRSSRETNIIDGSDDEDYSRASGDYDDIINEDYSESEYELPDISPTIYPTNGLDGFTSIRNYEDDYIISVSPGSSGSRTSTDGTSEEMKTAQSNGFEPYLIWICVAVGGVILIAAIAAIIVSWKKSKSKPETSYAEAKPVPAPRKPRTIV